MNNRTHISAISARSCATAPCVENQTKVSQHSNALFSLQRSNALALLIGDRRI